MLDKSIKWKAQQLKVKRRRRDDFNYNFRLKRDDSTQIFVNDPLWNITWYLSRGLTSNLPDMNVTGAWKLGYSGKGVVRPLTQSRTRHIVYLGIEPAIFLLFFFLPVSKEDVETKNKQP